MSINPDSTGAVDASNLLWQSNPLCVTVSPSCPSIMTDYSLAASCRPSTFSNITFFGGEVLDIQATLITNYTAYAPEALRLTAPAVTLTEATFCNVTIAYTHPGQDDRLTVETWLPVENPGWNGRLEAVGGGGWAAGRLAGFSYGTMTGALADGFATTTTDGGVSSENGFDPSSWVLNSPGNVNWLDLNNFAFVSLKEQAIIGKAVITSFYGRGPSYSYWNGCSQGGRQGLQLAQRYPDAYDGIVAGAPGLYLTRVAASLYWPQQVMNNLQAWPYGCELDALSAAATAACDGLDGVIDGAISASADECLAAFDPFTVVGTPVENCRQAGNRTVEISRAAAAVVNATWHGVTTAKGKKVWHGVPPGADLSNDGADGSVPGVAVTDCSSGTCVGIPQPLTPPWFNLFLAGGDPSFDLASMTHEEYDEFVHLSRHVYRSTLETDDPDLSRFRDAGGKLITWHGLWDELIPSKGTEQYYNEVAATVSDVDGFFRHFEIPGLGHCFGRSSSNPTSLFAQLQAWVENSTAPTQSSVKLTVPDGSVHNRIICAYPKMAVLGQDGCDDPADEGCWSCV
ncbi:hypothetical protein VTJ49DRAFT_4184 [Mycothermus thermophilus]|uniref:Carboxylic ester hydrolase n=1 Tax=Humicola insolens TaxID=85995 RepID=A0ABR3V5Y5_HUMIN